MIINVLVSYGANMRFQVRKNDIGYFVVAYLGRIVEAQLGSSST